MVGETQQRLRITFSKGVEVKYTSHLDTVRCWERALRRADVPLAYSHGFNPRPRLFFAAALPVGVTGRAELLDVLLERRLELPALAARVKAQLPSGIQVEEVVEVALDRPPLPSRVVAALYQVLVAHSAGEEDLHQRLDRLLAADALPRERRRRGQVRAYDLRPLIDSLWLVGPCQELFLLGMLVRHNQQGTGRPDEVMAALGLNHAVRAVERIRVVTSEDSAMRG